MNAEPTSGLVLINGRVQTLEPSSRMAEAVAIFGGRIVEVGSTEEVRAALPGAPTVDLEGGTVLPGFTDSHTHFKRASAFLSLYIDFEGVEPTASPTSRKRSLPGSRWSPLESGSRAMGLSRAD